MADTHTPCDDHVPSSTIERFYLRQLSDIWRDDGTLRNEFSLDGTRAPITELNQLFISYLEVDDGVKLSPHRLFLPLVTRCITGTFESVQFSDETMKSSCGISAMETLALRQLLVVLAIRHRNEDLLPFHRSLNDVPGHLRYLLDGGSLPSPSQPNPFWDAKLPDGSCADETPLHAAVQADKLEVVEYLLKIGATAKKDAWDRDQKERAVFLGKKDIVDLFEEFGWK